MHPADVEDPEVLSLLARPDKAEARAWLAEVHEPRRTLGTLSPAASARLVDSLYELGAALVLVAGLSDGRETQRARRIITQRPYDREASTGLLNWSNEYAAARGYMTDLERNQSYLFNWVD